MGLLSGLLGNASAVGGEALAKEFGQLLAPAEKVICGYKLVRDVFIFTEKRLLIVDKQGLTGRKTEYHSIPYRSITHFSVETAGSFDLDAELKIWISSTPEPIAKQFTKQVNVYAVQSLLASMVCR